MDIFFNVVIDRLNLWENTLSRKQCTWANSMANPIFKKFDQVLMSTNLKQQFQLVSICALVCNLSNHTPLLLDTGLMSTPGKSPLLKFKLGWLIRDGLHDLVIDSWKNKLWGNSAIII